MTAVNDAERMRFRACLPFVLREEGGNSDDPHDPGGRTSRGITQSEYWAWRRAHGQKPVDVYRASDDEVEQIYYALYWLPRCRDLPPGFDLCFFDMAVNAGPAEAARCAAGLDRSDVAAAIRSFSARRLKFYRSLHTYKYFGRGWTARAQAIEQAALALAQQEKIEAAHAPANTAMATEPPRGVLGSIKHALARCFRGAA